MLASRTSLRIYNVIGYGLLGLHIFIAGFLAPAAWGPVRGLAFGLSYLILSWLVAGIYVSLIVHMGIAHRALVFKPWFSQSITVLQNTIGVYINPTEWVMRHRRHHALSDREGDPSKLPDDGFLKVVWMAIFPYACNAPAPRDSILTTWPYRLVSNNYWAAFSYLSSYAVLLLLTRGWAYAALLWLSQRLIALWGYLIINYWCHNRRFGERRYDDDNDTVNIGGWLAVTATLSGSLHNNHHHAPHFLRLSHDPHEYDFGFLVLRWIGKLGLVRASATGLRVPAGVVVTPGL